MKDEKEKIERLLDENSDIIKNLNKDLQDKLIIIERSKNEKIELIRKLSDLEEKFLIKVKEVDREKEEKIKMIENLSSFESSTFQGVK